MTHTRELWVDRDGVRLFAVDLGPLEARPIVFLHGGLADHRASLFRVGAIAPRCRVIAPDLRGAGRSIFRGALTWDALADDVVALLDQLGLDRALIAGTSAGAAVALRVALRHPARVAALALIAPAFAGGGQGLYPAQKIAMGAIDAHAQRALSGGIDALLPLYAQLPEPIRDRAIAMMRSFDPGSVAATARLLASGAQPFDDPRELAALTMPTVLVRGADPEHPPEVCDTYAAHIAGARVLDAHVEPTVAIDLLARTLGW